MTQIVVKMFEENSVVAEQALPEDVVLVAERFSAKLTPLHPGVQDASLSTYYTADVDDPSAAEALAGELRLSDSVDAAYIKPTGEPPQTTGD